MNHLFTLKARIILFSLLIFHLGLKAQTSEAKADTATGRRADTSYALKMDTSLAVKAGSTLVIKSDTVMVINPDAALIGKAVDALAKKVDVLTIDSATAKKMEATNIKAADGVARPDTNYTMKERAAKSDKTYASVNIKKDGVTTSAPVTTYDDAVKSSDPVSTPLKENAAPAGTVKGVIEIKQGSGAITSTPVKADLTLVKAPEQANTISKQEDVPSVKSADPATTAPQQAAATPVKTSDPATKPVKEDQVAKTDTNYTQKENVSPAANTNAATDVTKDNAVKAAPEKSEFEAAKKIDPGTPDTNIGNTSVSKSADSAMAKKADTTMAKKTDTTLVKKSDTTIVEKPDTVIIHEIKAQNAYLEVGGPGLAISANYDTRFKKERNGWGYRIGLGYFASGGNTVFTIPFQINYLIGEHSHMLELGAGTTFLNSTGTNVGNSRWEFDKVTGFIATGTIGYRFQPAHTGINFRLAFVPILYDEGLIPAGGISVGYTFK